MAASSTCPHDDVLGAARAMEEVPRPQPALLLFNDQQTLTRHHEKPLLGVLAVVHAHRLAWLEDADVDPKLREPPLAFEGAVGTKWPFVPPTRLASIQDEPALAVDNETVLAHPDRGLGCHLPARA